MGVRFLGSSGGGGAPIPMMPTFTPGHHGIPQGSAVLVQAGGAVNSWGSWTSLGTLTAAIDRLDLFVGGALNRAWLLELRKGGSTTIVQALPLQTNSLIAPQLSFPLRIETGALEARVMCSAAGQSLRFGPVTYQSDVPQSLTIVEPIGPAPTTTTPGVAANSDGAFTLLTTGGATAAAYKRLRFFLGNITDFARVATTYVIDLSTTNGSGGIFFSFLLESGTNSPMAIAYPELHHALASGSDVYIRITPAASTAGSGSDPLNTQLHGIR